MLKTGHGVEKLLGPQSIALVGVSGDTGKAGVTGATGIMANLIKYGFKGNIYPINPKYDDILGYKSYPDLASVPEPVDLLAIGIKSEAVLPIFKQAAETGVGSCIIITSGFGEDNREDHRQMQNEMSRLSRESGMRICGPNCLGIINVHQNIVAMSSVGLSAGPVNPGGVALVTQSGALASSFLAKGKDKGIGFSYVISSGNEADLDLADYIHFLVDDPNTKAIAAYIEGMKDGERFKEAAALCWEKNKPLIVFKVGRSERGAMSAAAHTGSIAGSDEIINAMFDKYNVARVDSVDDLLEVAQAFALQKLPCVGSRLGIITVSGGAGGIVSDISEDLGLEIPDLESETVSRVGTILPSYTSVKNPIDTTADILREPENLMRTAQALETDKNVDIIYFSLTAGSPAFEKKEADVISRYGEQAKKPVVVSWFSGNMNQEGMRTLQERGVPCFSSYGTSLAFVKLLSRRSTKDSSQIQVFEKLAKAEVKIPDFIKQKAGVLSEFDSKQVLKSFGIPVVEEINAQSLSEAKKFAQSINYPVVVKINSADIPHKSDAGCVAINIRNASELEKAYDTVMKNALKYKKDANIQGMLVQEMVQNARECIIGVKCAPSFGPVVMFGLGGIFVEVLKDVAFKMAPITAEEAKEMIMRIKGHKLLAGYRGQAIADIDAIADVLQKVGRLACGLKDNLRELDINPLMVLEAGRGAKVADALVVLSEHPSK